MFTPVKIIKLMIYEDRNILGINYKICNRSTYLHHFYSNIYFTMNYWFSPIFRNLLVYYKMIEYEKENS